MELVGDELQYSASCDALLKEIQHDATDSNSVCIST
jgi:hypothetical protein